MAYSYVAYIASSGQTQFVVPFAYIAQSHVKVKINNVVNTSFVWLSNTQIQLTASTANDRVFIYRETSPDQRLVDFVIPGQLTEEDLDTAFTQTQFLSQEALDNSVLGIFEDPAIGTFSAVNKVISNVANPVSAQDAATKNWAETALTSQLALGTAQAVIANTKASEAAVSATNSETSKTASGVSATASATSAAESAASASTATTQAALSTTNGAAQVTLATAQAVIATAQAAAVIAADSNASASATASAASATESAASAATATTQAGLATTNGAAQVTLATAQKTIATTKASEASTSASNAASSLASFTGQYVSQSGAPSSPSTGDLWFDTSSSTMKVYNGSAWANAGSSVNGVENSVQHTATAGQTSFAATYDAGYVQVYLNGIRLDAADYTATNGSAVVLAVAAAVGDTVFIQGFGTFALADVYTKSVADGRFKAIGATEGGPALGLNSIIRTNALTISENITIPVTSNGMSAGPITIADGYTVTLNGTWSIV